MKQARIAPSMMCVDYSRLTDTIRTFEEEEIDYLHMDFMDGIFVPNYALGSDFCRQIRKMTSIPQDLHLMIDRPDQKLSCWDIREGDIVSIHYESTPHLPRVFAEIHRKKAKAFLALNPSTPVDALDYILDEIDGVLIMTVDPGFAGQKMEPGALRKIRDTRRFLKKAGKDIPIEVDGNVSFEHARMMREAGADIFVGGSSSIFSDKGSIRQNIQELRQSINQAEVICCA